MNPEQYKVTTKGICISDIEFVLICSIRFGLKYLAQITFNFKILNLE